MMHRPWTVLALVICGAALLLYRRYCAGRGVFYGKGSWFTRDEQPRLFRATLHMLSALAVLFFLAAIAASLGLGG